MAAADWAVVIMIGAQLVSAVRVSSLTSATILSSRARASGSASAAAARSRSMAAPPSASTRSLSCITVMGSPWATSSSWLSRIHVSREASSSSTSA